MENKFPSRKRMRMENYDYSSYGAYFITICTQNKKPILSRIVGGDVLDAPIGDVLDAPTSYVQNTSYNVKLLPYGKIADRYIKQLSDFYNHISVESYVIMPNHIHLLLFVKPTEDELVENTILSNSGASRTSPPTRQHSTISRFVSTFKRYCNREYEKTFGKNLFMITL